MVSEDFLGLYSLSAIDAQNIMQAMKDVFLRFQIPFAKLRGQCYDAAILWLEQGQGLLLRSKKYNLELCLHTAMVTL